LIEQERETRFADCSEKMLMTFGKPGRPPEDRLLRQREIFEMVAPLIVAHGARISMREAADAACLSVGGLYHYFPTKRDLVLHGLDPAARRRICADEGRRLSALLRRDELSLVDFFVDTTLRLIAFMRPSVIAALDLGDATLQQALDARWTRDVGEMVDGFRIMLPDAPVANLSALARSIRREMLGALIEPEVDIDVVRADLQRLIGAHVDSLSMAVVA
jgi:AcrR family transcriptional regulator